MYARARHRGQQLPRPVEDTRQLGGKAIAVDGVITRRWVPRSPDDGMAPALLVSTARAAAQP